MWFEPEFMKEPYFLDFLEWERSNMPAPDLSHYYGRRVEDIRKGTGVDGEPAWSLVLEGGVIVQNYDDALPVPGDHIKGQIFSNMTLHPRVTSMFFGGLGGNTVSLTPMKYAIASASTDKPYWPQVSETSVHWTPPPPEGRDADKAEEYPNVETE